MADLDHSPESGQTLIVDLVLAEQFGVVAKVTQKPVQLPQRFRRAIEASGDALAGIQLGLDDREPEEVIGLLCLPAMLRFIDPK